MLRRRLAARLQPPLLELGQIDPDGLQVAPLGVNSRGAVHPQLLRLPAKLGVGLARNIVNGPGRVLWMTRQCRRARIRHSAPRPGAKLHEQPTRTIAAATPSRRSVRDGRPEIRKKPFLTPSTMPNKSKRSLGGCYTNMTDDLKNTSTMEAAAEDWARVNLPPRLTGLPMAVWITEKRRLSARCAGQCEHSAWRSRLLARRSVDRRATSTA